MTHFRPAPSGLKGPRTFLITTKPARSRRAPGLLVPALLPPAAASAAPGPAPRCRVLPEGSGGERTAPFGQLLRRPPRRLARPGAGPWLPRSSRKGAAAAEDARWDCADGGPVRARRAAVAGPAAFFQVPLPRRVARSGSAPSLVRLAGPSRRGLIAFQLGGRRGGGAVAPTLIIAFSLFLPASLRSPEPGGARTWRGKLHPRPGPRTPPPPLSIILGTGNGLCIARCTCD